MILALWTTPALLAGLFAILWVTTRLERLVGRPRVPASSPTPRGVGTSSAPVAAGAASTPPPGKPMAPGVGPVEARALRHLGASGADRSSVVYRRASR